MALKQYREAARTAIIIAREEQNAGRSSLDCFVSVSTKTLNSVEPSDIHQIVMTACLNILAMSVRCTTHYCIGVYKPQLTPVIFLHR